MSVDKERIYSKIAYIQEQINSIRVLLKEKSREEILSDMWILKGLKYSIQTAIESMIDIVFHICAKYFNKAPVDSRDGFRILFEKGVINNQEYMTYSAMIGFRNRIVHGYQEVTSERVYEIAANELGDFERFIINIIKFIDKI